MALGMRHHAQHIAPLIYDTGDIELRTVRVGGFGNLSICVAVAKNNLVPILQALQRHI